MSKQENKAIDIAGHPHEIFDFFGLDIQLSIAAKNSYKNDSLEEIKKIWNGLSLTIKKAYFDPQASRLTFNVLQVLTTQTLWKNVGDMLLVKYKKLSY